MEKLDSAQLELQEMDALAAHHTHPVKGLLFPLLLYKGIYLKTSKLQNIHQSLPIHLQFFDIVLSPYLSGDFPGTERNVCQILPQFLP